MSNRQWLLCAAQLALLAPLLVGAAEVQVAAGVGAGHSDNILRKAAGAESESLGQATLQLAVSETSRRLAAELAADLAYVEYFGDAYDSELTGSVNGQATVALVPDRLQWIVADTFGQTRRDLFAAATPENRENINYFSTGPDAILRFDANNSLRVGGRYARVDYETSPFDSERGSGSLGLLRDLSSGSTLSVNATTERVSYSRSSAGPDYDRRQLYLGYDVRGERTTIRALAGASEIDRAGTRDRDALLRLDITRRLASRSQLSLSLGRALTDAGSAFGQAGQGVIVSNDTQSLARSSNPFTSNHVRAGWDVLGRVTRLGASAGFYRESYLQATAQDRDRTVAEIHLYRQFGTRLSARATVNYANDNFRNVVGDAYETAVRLGMAFRVGRQLNVEGTVEQLERRSDVRATDYSESRIWLNLRWGTALVRRVGAFGNL